MAKLQRIEKKSPVWFIYLPKIEVEKAGLKKGDQLDIYCTSKGELVIRKHGTN